MPQAHAQPTNKCLAKAGVSLKGCLGKHQVHSKRPPSPCLLTVGMSLQIKNYGYIPSALPDSKCYGDAGPKSPSDITKALADVFTTSEAPALTGSPAAPSTSSADSSAATSLQGTSYRPSPSIADTAEAGTGAMLGMAGSMGSTGSAVTEAPQVVHQPTPVPEQGA